MKTSPLQRSLKKLRSEGWFCAVTEHWNPFAKIRQDLFNFVDILCLRSDVIMAVQTTSASNLSARIEKIKATQVASLWLECPTRKIMVHAWSKKGARGQRKTWQCREVEIKEI